MKYYRKFKNYINNYLLCTTVSFLYSTNIDANDQRPSSFFDQEAIKFVADQNKLILALNNKDKTEVEACLARMELTLWMLQNTVTPNRFIVLSELTEGLMMIKSLIKKNK